MNEDDAKLILLWKKTFRLFAISMLSLSLLPIPFLVLFAAFKIDTLFGYFFTFWYLGIWGLFTISSVFAGLLYGNYRSVKKQRKSFIGVPLATVGGIITLIGLSPIALFGLYCITLPIIIFHLASTLLISYAFISDELKSKMQ